VIEALDGSFRFRVDDAQRLGQVVAHVGAAEGRVEPGSAVRATVDRERRARTRKNHTATHLLHQALRHVLGEHVTQQGSYVGPDRLRFDLSHPSAITPEELERIEALVNERVFANAGVRTTVEDLQAARARGVMALFGEKYDDRVRVVDVDGWSTELCGGTHVRAVGDIGPFVIVSESAIQAGVRRIEAVTGPAAVERMQRQRRTLLEVARALKSAPDEVLARVEQLQSQVKEAKKSAAKSALSDVSDALAATLAALKDDGGVRVGFVTLDLPQAALRELGNRLKAGAPDLAAALVVRDGDRLPWLALAQGRARERGDDARKLAELLRRELGGGGGGKPELAQGQGQDRSGLERARTAFERDPRAALQGA
jgi:alanyl-tRNA synthetase